jgi:hypothetical protein
MSEHYIVTLDQGQLRIYAETRSPAQFQPRLEVVDALDLNGVPSRTGDLDLPLARRFHPAGQRPPGAQRAERSARTPPRRRGVAGLLAAELDAFMRQRPHASWDFAAAPAVYSAVMKELSADTRRRLKRVLSAELAQHGPDDVRSHFALMAS